MEEKKRIRKSPSPMEDPNPIMNNPSSEEEFTDELKSSPLITDVTNYDLSKTVKVNAGAEVTLNFDVTGEKTYWIKAIPIYTPSGTITDLTYPTYITTTGILYTEDF